jgi:hypothetical protein
MKNVVVKIQVPDNVHRLIQEVCRIDGTDPTQSYETWLIEGISAYLNEGHLFHLPGLAKKFQLHKAFRFLDTAMYGKE